MAMLKFSIFLLWLVDLSLQQCDQGWSYFDGSKACYRVQSTELDWYSADDDCQEYGARLATIMDGFQQSFIKGELQQHGTCSYYWIGGRFNDGYYQWVDGGRVTYSNYGNPGSNQNAPGYCLDVQTSSAAWYTYSCKSTACFICEKNATSQTGQATDCKQLKAQGKTTSGVYTIYINGVPKNVYCDMETEGGGWTVIQQRIDGSTPFYNQNWQAYKNGFGTVSDNSEFWIGNEVIHQLTTQTSGNILRVDLWGDRNPNSTDPNIYLFSEYNFTLADESTDYTPNVWINYPGVGNASTGWYDITYSNGIKFSTVDHINDPMPTCVTDYHLGGWWLHYCTVSSLNGQYIPPHSYGDGYGLFWIVNGYQIINPKKTKMMIRSL